MTATTELDAYLAGEVNRVALLVPAAGRFGGKVFVAALFNTMQVHSRSVDGCDLVDLKAFLLRGAQAGLVRIERADLVEAMDPDLVAASAIRDGFAEYHFVVA